MRVLHYEKRKIQMLEIYLKQEVTKCQKLK